MFLSDGLGVVGGEQACLVPQLALPPGPVGAIKNLDDIAGVELQLVLLLSVETVQSSDLLRGGGFVLLGSEEEEVQDDRQADRQIHKLSL